MKCLFLLLITVFTLPVKSQPLQAISVNLFNYSPTGERTLMDGVGILFNDAWSDTVDLDDAKKLTNPLENIAVLRNGILLGIEKRFSKDSIPLILWNLEGALQQLEIIARAVNNIFLEDIALHTITPVINDTLRYSFTSAAGDTTKRFHLVFYNTLSLTNTLVPLSPAARQPTIRLFPNPAAGGFVNILMFNTATGNYTISIIGYNQKRIFHLLHLNNRVETIPINLPAGNYHVMVDNEKGNSTIQQLMIQ